MATTARQQYFADESSLSKEKREFSIADEIQQKIDSIEEGAQVNKIETIKVNGTALVPDAYKAVDIDVPEVIDNLYTVDSDNALSAKQGKLLYDYIQNIASRGRFLSNWNSATGLPMTNPSESPYPYKSGDYFVVSNVAGLGGTNYRPDGSSYIIGQASTVVETEDISVSDFYFYDGTNWLLLSNSGRQIAVDSSLSTTSTNPVENRVITNALNGKQEALIAGNNIQIAADGKTISATDTTYSAGANISIDANNEISAVDTTYTAGTNVQISNQNVISATDTKYTAGTGINIDANNVISNTQTSAEWGNITGTLSDQTDLQTVLNAKQDDMVILKYGISTWNDFITAYNKNGVIYCRASSNSDPASGSQTRLAFMAYVNNETTPTEVEFQYYRSRSDHNSAANQLDQVFVYKLTSASGGTWTVTERNTAAKSTAGTGISLTYSSGNMTIANTGVTSFNGDTGAVTYTAPVTSVNGQTGAVTLTIPTVNNATLTIQKNGTDVQTFTANQSTNATANITVPTDTGDLTNGAGFITGITSSDVTTALGYTPADDSNTVHKTGNEEISGEKTFNSNVNYKYTQTYRDANGNASTYAYGVYQWGDNMQYTLRNAANNAYINTAFELTPTQMTVGRTLVVPSKTTDATNDGTLVATEAQVYKKQDTISDLATIRSGASAGATALQPNANISSLTNDSGYLTSSTGVTTVNGSHGAVTVTPFSPGGTATTGYVVTKTASGYEWAAPSGGIEVDSASPIQLTKIWAGTQAQYEALASYDATTVYLTI